jgi:hypothetical protein
LIVGRPYASAFVHRAMRCQVAKGTQYTAEKSLLHAPQTLLQPRMCPNCYHSELLLTLFAPKSLQAYCHTCFVTDRRWLHTLVDVLPSQPLQNALHSMVMIVTQLHPHTWHGMRQLSTCGQLRLLTWTCYLGKSTDVVWYR